MTSTPLFKLEPRSLIRCMKCDNVQGVVHTRKCPICGSTKNFEETILYEVLFEY